MNNSSYNNQNGNQYNNYNDPRQYNFMPAPPVGKAPKKNSKGGMIAGIIVGSLAMVVVLAAVAARVIISSGSSPSFSLDDFMVSQKETTTSESTTTSTTTTTTTTTTEYSPYNEDGYGEVYTEPTYAEQWDGFEDGYNYDYNYDNTTKNTTKKTTTTAAYGFEPDYYIDEDGNYVPIYDTAQNTTKKTTKKTTKTTKSSNGTVKLTKEIQYQTNIFLSNYSETITESFKGTPPKTELVSFGMKHNYINRKSKFQKVNTTINGARYSLRINKKYVTEIVKKYFGVTLTDKNYKAAAGNYPFKDNYLYCMFDGYMSAGFTIVDKLTKSGNTYTATFTIYDESNWKNNSNRYKMSASEIKNSGKRATKVGSGTAKFTASKIGDRHTYKIKSYSVKRSH